MSLGFDNPGLLPFAALAALPVLLHFIARPRPRPLKFPSLMLLEKAHRESVRVQRPRHWLLLILRTLLTILLIGVFLQPRWFNQAKPEAAGGGRVVVLVVDATASMRAREGTQSRYTQAVTESISLLQQLQPGDRANIIRVRAVPESFYAEPGSNHEYLKAELRKRPCSREGGSLSEGLRLAVEQLARSPESSREIVVISDFQADAEGGAPQLSVPEGIRLTVLPAAREAVPNQAVTALRLLPARPVSGLPFDVQVEVHNYSEEPVRRQLTLQAGERHEQQTLQLPPGRASVAVFTLEAESEEALTLTASLDPDAFPEDDVRYGAVPLRARHRIGVWGSDATAEMWLRSLRAMPGVETLVINSPEVLPAALDALYLSGWRGEALTEVQSFVEAGGSLVFRPARIPPELSAWLNIPEGTLAEGRLDSPLGLRIPDPWPETLALFEDGRYGSPVKGLIKAHAVFPIQDPPLDPILSLENGETLWGAFPSRPGVYFWNISLDPDHSDLTAQAEWIPMFGEGLRHLFRASENLLAEAGTVLPLEKDNREGSRPVLEDSRGEALATREIQEGMASAEPLPPGHYRWRKASGETAGVLRAVNLPVSESNLQPAEPERIDGGSLPVLKQAASWRMNHQGRPLWPWLLALAFLVAGCEQVVTHRRNRT